MRIASVEVKKPEELTPENFTKLRDAAHDDLIELKSAITGLQDAKTIPSVDLGEIGSGYDASNQDDMTIVRFTVGGSPRAGVVLSGRIYGIELTVV